MPDLPVPERAGSEAAIDGLSSALFAGFVALLFLGYFDSSLPYTGFAIALLLGALATLFWANLRSDRRERTRGTLPPS